MKEISGITSSMIKLTLDTNCIINLLDFKATTPTSVDELSEIIRYGLDGDVNIAITTRVEEDLGKDKDGERREEMIRKLKMFPVIGTMARYDVSKYNSGDFWVGDEHKELAKELQALLFPALDGKDKHYGNKITDIDHLVGHVAHRRDIFITDDQGILRKKDKLEDSFGITVMSPTEALEYLDLQAKKDVLVQQVLDKVKELHNLLMGVIEDGYTEDKEKQYREIREWLLKKYPKIQDGLLAFRHRMRSVPVGGQRVFYQDDIMSLHRIPHVYEALFRERTLKEKIQELFPRYSSHNDMPKNIKIEKLEEQFGWAVDLLTSYVGYLEA